VKAEPQGTLQYGLIAEEVNAIYPGLVIRDDTGAIQGIRYDELAPLLLAEVQEQQRTLLTEHQLARTQSKQLSRMQQQIAELTRQNIATQFALEKLEAGSGASSR
jgi:hypothetical protein